MFRFAGVGTTEVEASDGVGTALEASTGAGTGTEGKIASTVAAGTLNNVGDSFEH